MEFNIQKFNKIQNHKCKWNIQKIFQSNLKINI